MTGRGSITPAHRPMPLGNQSPALVSDVQEALEHLYDYVFLQHNHLSSVVGTTVEGWHRGASLHRLLVETIDRLKPPPGTPSHSQLWRRYRHAFMRYIESATVAQIAEELGVSERQARRDNRDAVEAVAALLRQRLGPPLETYPSTEPGVPPALRVVEARGVGLQKEVERIGAIEPHGPTNLKDVVSGSIATVSNLALDKRITFEIQLPTDSSTISAERTAIRQVVLGLLVGAIDLALPDSQIVVGIEVDRDRATLTITAVRAAQAPADSVERFQDRLSIAKRLAAPFGIAIGDQLAEHELRVSFSAPTVRQTTVLLVDDNPGMLRLLKRYLGGSEYTVVEANVPDDALALAQEIQPDVITLDVMMPSKDGWEVLQTLRAQPRTQHIPVVVCSVLKEQDLARSLGAAAFLAKPINQAALLRALSEVRKTPGR